MHARTFLLLAAACLTLALPACLPLAQQAANGDAQAQFRYGRKLLTGKGAPRAPERALIWLHYAAEQGHPKATAAIALCHERGLGTPRDAGLARQWYEKAERLGHQESTFSLAALDIANGSPEQAVQRLDTLCQSRNLRADLTLASLYFDNGSPHRNPENGIRYLRYAAMDGSADAAFLMAVCYAEGIGVPESDTLAAGWLKLAAERGNKLAIKILKDS